MANYFHGISSNVAALLFLKDMLRKRGRRCQSEEERDDQSSPIHVHLNGKIKDIPTANIFPESVGFGFLRWNACDDANVSATASK